jgi:uncharacterized XkdX family phage protein
MDWFKIIKTNYDAGNYTVENVRVFVTKGKITPEQFTEITGQAY